MVYCGKPSRGCQNCKTRRIKCDEVRPTCTQCKKSNRACPGYPDEFDLIFRNETMAVKRRAQRAFSASNARNSKAKAAKKTLQTSKVDKPVRLTTPAVATTFAPPIVSSSIRPDQVDFTFGLDYDSSYLIPPALDRRSRSDSSSSSGSPPSDIQDDESYVGSHTDALIRTPLASKNSSPIIFESSPIYDKFYHASPSPIDMFESCPFKLAENSLNPPTSIPIFATLPSEYTAIPYFFKSHVCWQRHEDSQTGYLELLPKMYGSKNASPLLHTATYAVALGIMSNAYQSREMRCEARKQYGKALHNLGLAIKDVNMATADEIIMTILLFVLYEQIMGDVERKVQWTSHIHGAVALVKMRAKEQLSSPMSTHLFRAVRSLMLKAAIQRKVRLEEFPDDKGWRCDEGLGLNTANRLTLICLDIPNLKASCNELVDAREKTPAIVRQMLDIIDRSQAMDAELEAWAHALPAVWKPWTSKIVTEMPQDIKNAEFWPGPVFSYHDLNIATITNEYRVSRILVNGVVRDLVQVLPIEAQTELLQRAYTKAMYVARQMCDDFSSTLPFMLGHDYYSRPGACIDEERSTRATGAFFSVWPAIIMRMNPHIPDLQRRWLGCRLLFICANYGLRDPEAQKVLDQMAAQAAKARESMIQKHQQLIVRQPYIRQIAAQ